MASTRRSLCLFSLLCGTALVGMEAAFAGAPAASLEETVLGVPVDLPAVGLLVWGTPARWGLISVTHRPFHRWIPLAGDPAGLAFLGFGRDRHSVVACDIDRDGKDEVLVSVGSQRGQGDNGPELWALRDGVWEDRAPELFPPLIGHRGRGVTCDDVDGDGRPELGLFGYPGRVADTVLRWDGAAWVDVAPAWGLAVSANTHGARFEDMDGDGDLDALRLVNRRLELLVQERGPRFVAPVEPVGGQVSGFIPFDADNDGDVDLFLARSRPPQGDAAGDDGFRLELPGDDEDWLTWKAPARCGRVTMSLSGDLGDRPAAVRAGTVREPVVELDMAMSTTPSRPASSQVEAWVDAPTRTVSLRARGPGESLRGTVRCADGGAVALVYADTEPPERWIDAPSQLWLNDGKGQFTAAAGAVPPGPIAAHLGRPAPADVDLDGDIDVLMVTNVAANEPTNPPDYLLLNDGRGQFAVAAGFPADTAPEGGLIAVAADLDGDRYAEFVVVNTETPGAGRAFVWKNPGGTNGWVEVEVYDKGGRARSLSATVEVRSDTVTQRRRSTPYPDYRANGNLATVFGVGVARQAEVRVRWPDGATADWRSVAAGATLRVVHP